MRNVSVVSRKPELNKKNGTLMIQCVEVGITDGKEAKEAVENTRT
jgi:hypothetical protein